VAIVSGHTKLHSGNLTETLTSTSVALNEMKFLAVTGLSGYATAYEIYYTDTSGSFTNNIVPIYRGKVGSGETKIYRATDFPTDGLLGGHATEKILKITLRSTTYILAVSYVRDDAGVSTDYTTEALQDIVGAMFTGNTETGIAATYEDSDGTIDLVVSDVTDLHTAGVDGAANQLLTDDGDGTVSSEANLTFDSTTSILTATSGLGTVPQLILKSNSAGAIGPKLFITHNSASPAADDYIGSLIWQGEDADDNTQTYGEIQVQIVDPASGTEGGKMRIRVATHNGTAIDGVVLEDGGAVNTTNVTLAYGASSTTHVSGNLTLAGTVDGRDIATDGTKLDGLVTGADPFNSTTIKILPDQFVINDDTGRPLMVEDDTSNILGVSCFGTTDEMYAWQKIPSGYKVTHVQVHASASTASAVKSFSYNYQTGADNAVTPTTADLNEDKAITNIPASATQDLVVKVTPGSGTTIIYGATVTIATI
jgi:hypothetical protein